MGSRGSLRTAQKYTDVGRNSLGQTLARKARNVSFFTSRTGHLNCQNARPRGFNNLSQLFVLCFFNNLYQIR
jgi:hypothetical protein